ncbi:MAG TPA: YdcF family protein [Coleofasciculaceae cyanobacterium]
MFELNTCYRNLSESLIKLPVSTDWSQLGWRKLLLLTVLISLAIIGIRWLMHNKAARRWLRSTQALIVLFCITVSIPLMFVAAAKGLVAFLPPDTGEKVEAIVVLGRGPDLGKERVDVASELWQAKRAPRIFVSGFSDAYSLVPQFQAQGIPPQAIDAENCSMTTWENAIFSAAVLHPQGIRRILLVTDEPHMLRSLLLYRANGFSVIPSPNPLPSDYGFKATAFLTLREYLGLIGYTMQGLFDPKRSPQIDEPKLEKLVQQAKQYGQEKQLKW